MLEEKTEEIASSYSTQHRSRLIPGAFEATDFFPAIRGGSWLHFTAAPIYDDDGTIIGAVETLHDVTERKLAIESLKESEERYRTLIEKSNDGIAIVRGDIHAYANRRFAEILGYEECEDIIGKTLSDIVYVDDCSQVIEFVGKGQRGEPAPEHHEFRGVKKDGTIVFLEASSTRMDYLGEHMTLAFIRDVTDRKQAEEERERLQARLVQAEKMEAIGTLTGGIAHDFNNVLTVLIGYAALVRRRLSTSDPLRVYVDHILSASQKAAALTQSLLAFSRRQPITLAPINLNQQIKGTENLLRRLLTEDIALTIELCLTDQSISGDPVQIDQILLNLVSNARDAMPQGGILTIATEVVYLNEEAVQGHGVSRSGDYLVLTVTDTGHGMDERTVEKIFQPFFTTKEVGKGTGLGLSTVYGIVKQHSGGLAVHSEPDKGTTFRISFPAATTAAEASITNVPATAEGTETILVAEDDEDVRGFMKETLEYSGYTVIEAIDGEDAIVRFEERSGIDLVILDTIMPRRNGREAFEAILRCSPTVKVLFTSGHPGEVLSDKGIPSDDLNFMAKPVSASELLARIRTVLDGGKGRQA